MATSQLYNVKLAKKYYVISHENYLPKLSLKLKFLKDTVIVTVRLILAS